MDLKPEDDTPPLDFGLLEIHEKTEGQTGGSQVVETLRRVFVDEAFGRFQLHHQHVFDKEIGKVLSDRVALVGNGKRSFRGGPDASEAEFSEQSTLVDLFEESGTKRVGDFEHVAKHLLASKGRPRGPGNDVAPQPARRTQ